MSSLKIPVFSQNEKEFMAKGKFKSVPSDPSFKALKIRHEFSNAKLSEAIARSESGDPLQLLKSLLARGTLGECSELIHRLLENVGEDLELKAEVLLQEARLEYHQGEWQNCVAICNLIEKFSTLPDAVKMALYQIRSNANFELTQFELSMNDYKKVESMESLYPHGQLPLYAHTNRVRIQARLIGCDYASLELQKLWNNWKLKLPTKNLDPLLTLLRSQIDLKRLNQESFTKEAVASYLVSKSLGDELYAGLAIFDLCLSLGLDQLSSEQQMLLHSFTEAHPRIQKLLAEVRANPQSETARSMKAFHKSIPNPSININATKIIVLDQSVYVDLPNGTSQSLKIQPKSLLIIQALAEGITEKEALFQRVWGISRFSMERHDPIIRTALKRVREQIGLEIQSQDRRVSLPSDLFVY